MADRKPENGGNVTNETKENVHEMQTNEKSKNDNGQNDGDLVNAEGLIFKRNEGIINAVSLLKVNMSWLRKEKKKETLSHGCWGYILWIKVWKRLFKVLKYQPPYH